MVRRGGFWLMNVLFSLTATLLSSTEAFTGRGLVYPGRNDLFELSVIHLNDFHARFVQTASSSGTCSEGYEDECVGGIARVYTATHQLVNERPNAIFLNAGDNFQGTLWYTVHGWNVTSTFMNMLPHDAMTIGNHEFDNGIAGLVPFLKTVNTPIVVTNIDDSEEPDIQGLYTNSTIIERSGTKIGVIGVILSTTDDIASTEKLKFLDEVETVNAEAERLKEQGIDIIVVLSHCGLDVDRVIAANCPNVDLIVGGHSHTFLYSGTPPSSSDFPRDEYPVVVVQEGSERTVLIVQAYAYTKYLGNLTVWFNAAGEVADWDGNPILLDSSVEPDPDVLAALVPWQSDVDALGLKEIGETKVDLYNNCRRGECNIGNLITDAMVDIYVGHAENSTYWTYAAIACINVGGIRSSIESTAAITYADLVINQPFDNTWDVLELKGSSLVELLEASVSVSYSETEFEGVGFLQWSGIKVTFNLSNPAYSRVTSLKIRCRACEVPIYEDVDLDEWYRIAIVSFLVEGKDGLTVIATDQRNHLAGSSDVESYAKYINKMSPIISGIEGRMTFEGTWSG